MISIRHSQPQDINAIEAIYNIAREKMRRSGNFVQWVDGYPSRQDIENDILKQQGYVCINESGEVVAAFAFILGEDHTYINIEGEWLNNEPYGTIHRLGSVEGVHGILHAVVEWAKSQTDDLRLDTHESNAPMLQIVEHEGFTYCGIIYVDNGTPRRAFHKRF